MDQAGISSSQFADTCEIPRPTLSQLLNGRNKKVSDEVIGKIHRAYPSLNVMWLMFGDGEMLNGGGPSSGAAPVSTPDLEPRADDPVQRAISFDADEPSGYHRAVKQPQRVASSTMNETIQSIMRGATQVRSTQRPASPGDRRVVKLLVFYNDNSFEEFGPSHSG